MGKRDPGSCSAGDGGGHLDLRTKTKHFLWEVLCISSIISDQWQKEFWEGIYTYLLLHIQISPGARCFGLSLTIIKLNHVEVPIFDCFDL